MDNKTSPQLQGGLGSIMPLIGCLTSRVRCQISRICQKAGYKLTPEEADILMIIRHCNGLPQSRLATMLGKDKAAVTRLINVLVKSGLVGRVQDKQDRRVVRAQITPEGEQAFINIWPEIVKLSEQALAGISQESLLHLQELLASINTNLKELDEQA